MKLGHLETRRVVINTLAPVFIGSGKEINKKEYVYYPNGRKIFIPELFKMYSFLEKRGLAAEYENFLLREKRIDLLGFLRQNKISDDEIKSFTEYSIDAGNAVIDERSRKGILLFIKDSHNAPYIPGSSLKGALRTAILSYKLKKSPVRESMARVMLSASRSNDMSKNRFLQDETRRIEASVFNKLNLKKEKQEDTVNDFMKALSISDSRPVSLDSMVLCTKIDFSVSGNEKTIPLYRECIKPGTELIFSITIDTSVAKEVSFSWNDLTEALKSFNDTYENDFADYFKQPPLSEITPCKNGQPIYMGGGVGFVSKTVVYPLLGKRQGLEYTSKLLEAKFPKEHNHEKDIEIGVSPHMNKFTQYDGKIYPMGRCEFVLKD